MLTKYTSCTSILKDLGSTLKTKEEKGLLPPPPTKQTLAFGNFKKKMPQDNLLINTTIKDNRGVGLLAKVSQL